MIRLGCVEQRSRKIGTVRRNRDRLAPTAIDTKEAITIHLALGAIPHEREHALGQAGAAPESPSDAGVLGTHFRVGRARHSGRKRHIRSIDRGMAVVLAGDPVAALLLAPDLPPVAGPVGAEVRAFQPLLQA